MSLTQIHSRFEQTRPYDILVTGATGFIGSRLIEGLTGKGYSVKAMTRSNLENKQNVKFVQADALEYNQLENALGGVSVAFYLLHSMEGDSKHWLEFIRREKIQAENFVKAATKAGVKRIIYLGGLVNEEFELSPHMQSRKNVGDILASSGIPVTQLKASLIIGAQGGSYAMLRYLVERLRVMVCPKWVKSIAQPIAVDDVISYLIGCMEKPGTQGKNYDIGGPEKVNYEQLMRIYSAYLNRNLFIIEIPFLTTRLSSYWVDLITPVKASLARPLVDSLVHDTIVKDDSILKIIPLKLKTIKESIDIATKEMQQNPPKTKSREEKTSFKLNQKILMISLFALAVCGTSYYWLDERNDVYQFGWLLGSFFWYLTICFAILFVQGKTRLGYMLAGMVSWVTLAFWLFDNFHVAFNTSLIAAEPSTIMTIRNFVGIIIASVSVIASHNVFHKVHEYQKKGEPI